VNWHEDVACRDADPDLFFPIGTTGAALRQVEEAKRICRVCPAQIQCLDWALENGVTDGLWGGATPEERRVIRSLSRKPTLRGPAGLLPGDTPATGPLTVPSLSQHRDSPPHWATPETARQNPANG